ncbi:hypothetical protein [Streptomyces antimycoticus]|uniref:hypothetical protein n=1 Tax=Streptomyces antimycoticus TaxID=68175 RepID=UPI0034082B1E
MVKAIGTTVRRAGINLVCRDAAGWDEQASYSAAIEADKEAADQVAVHTGHPYVTPSDQPLPTSRPRPEVGVEPQRDGVEPGVGRPEQGSSAKRYGRGWWWATGGRIRRFRGRGGRSRVRDGRLAVELPGRSLTTVVLR